jgi:hypothetical protein|tara:strand:+ start:242 stop:979 length:738 start_codon:yes stop_codon:yes gene_type:complete
MAIDLDALRAKHAELSNPGGGNANTDFLSNFLQINEGTNVVRVLPGKDEDTLFYAETKIHRIPDADGNIKNYHCRKVHGEKCPLCDAYYALWKEPYKDEDLARQIKPRARYYMNVVNRETGDVKILSIGVILFKKIIAAMLDEDFGDITDLDDGNDFKIIKQMEGQWPKYDQSQPRPKSSAAGSKAEVAAWMDSLHDIHALVKEEDYEETKTVAQGLFPSSEVSMTNPNPANEVGDDDYLSKMKG